jgi:ryanodine receptor 2
VGDDFTSYAYDGYRTVKWNGKRDDYGEAWAAGDVIGTLIDFENREISFYRNQCALGVAFKNIGVGPNMVYFPAISMNIGEKVEFNFGANSKFSINLP